MLARALLCTFSLIFVIAQPSPVAAQQESGGNQITPKSVAEPSGANSVIHNPAGLSALRRWEARVYNTEMDGPGIGAGTSLLFGAPAIGPLSIGFGYEHLRPGKGSDRGRMSLGVGLRLHSSLSLGFMWRRVLTDEEPLLDELDALDVGFLYRPNKWFSLGVTIQDVNTPNLWADNALPRRYDISLGVRPGTEVITIEPGIMVNEETGDVDYTARLRIAALEGWELVSHVGLMPRGKTLGINVGTSLAMHFGPGGVEGAVHLSQPADGSLGFSGFTVGTRLGGAPYPTINKRSNKSVFFNITSVGEQPRPGLKGVGYTFTHLVSGLDRLRRDDTVSTVVLRDMRSSFGWAQVEEIRNAVDSLKASGKRILAYLDQGDTRHMYMYAGADKIILNPTGGFYLTGLRVILSHYQEALSKLNVTTQWVRFGRYKSYPESFSRSGPTDDNLLVRNSLLDSLNGLILKGIGTGRNLTPKKVQSLIDNGPHLADEAKKAGLVDHLAYWDEIKKVVSKDLNRPVQLMPYRYPTVGQDSWGRRDRIAIIPIEGQIVDGKSRTVPILKTQMVGSKTIIRAIKYAMADPTIKGIVLRINSPGGSSVASEDMHRQISKAAKRKPIVASFSNVAASGGYYVAMGARHVYANDGTTTGSIGIFTGKPAFGELYKWLGINRITLTRGKRADLFGQDKPWTEEELKVMTSKLKSFYDLFIKRVSDHRKMTTKEVDAVSQGRVWMGIQARENKLIDQRGGVVHAIAHIKRLAKLDPNEPVGLVFLPYTTLEQRIRTMLGIQALAELFSAVRDSLATAYPFLLGYKAGEPLALMPYGLEIK